MSILNKTMFLLDNGDGSDLANILISKGIPPENELPKPMFIKTTDNSGTYLLSKLSDKELLQLLNQQPRKDKYHLNDLINIGSSGKNSQNEFMKLNENEFASNEVADQNYPNNRFKVLPKKVPIHSEAYFKLEDKQVKRLPSDSNYNALQQLNQLLHNHPLQEDYSVDEENKELLFDILVTQLKALCCTSKNHRARDKKLQYQSPFNNINPQLQPFQINFKSNEMNSDLSHTSTNNMDRQYLFLVVNDEIRSSGNDEMIFVDPNSLGENSNALILGPIASSLTDTQLKLVMHRISNELSKPEYLSLLKQLSNGTLGNSNIKNTKNLLSGQETRRYVKPHRCNHQSKLARVYGGPKWLICTGYLNINTPSRYD